MGYYITEMDYKLKSGIDSEKLFNKYGFIKIYLDYKDVDDMMDKIEQYFVY